MAIPSFTKRNFELFGTGPCLDAGGPCLLAETSPEKAPAPGQRGLKRFQTVLSRKN